MRGISERGNQLEGQKMIEFIALIALKNGMNPLRNSWGRFGEIVHYVQGKWQGI